MNDDAKKPAEMTDYVVLTVTNPTPGENQGKTRYTEVGRVKARTADAAIKAKKELDGPYTAVPARSLKVVNVKTEKVERVTIS